MIINSGPSSDMQFNTESIGSVVQFQTTAGLLAERCAVQFTHGSLMQEFDFIVCTRIQLRLGNYKGRGTNYQEPICRRSKAIPWSRAVNGAVVSGSDSIHQARPILSASSPSCTGIRCKRQWSSHPKSSTRKGWQEYWQMSWRRRWVEGGFTLESIIWLSQTGQVKPHFVLGPLGFLEVPTDW